jgi:hypothetical protein
MNVEADVRCSVCNQYQTEEAEKIWAQQQDIARQRKVTIRSRAAFRAVDWYFFKPCRDFLAVQFHLSN